MIEMSSRLRRVPAPAPSGSPTRRRFRQNSGTRIRQSGIAGAHGAASDELAAAKCLRRYLQSPGTSLCTARCARPMTREVPFSTQTARSFPTQAYPSRCSWRITISTEWVITTAMTPWRISTSISALPWRRLPSNRSRAQRLSLCLRVVRGGLGGSEQSPAERSERAELERSANSTFAFPSLPFPALVEPCATCEAPRATKKKGPFALFCLSCAHVGVLRPHPLHALARSGE